MATQSLSDIGNIADLLHQFGDIPPERIRFWPTPGSATEADLLKELDGPQKRLCELIDGTLVEKPMGITESILAGELLRLIGNFLSEHDLGWVAGADGPFRILPDQVRLPDVSVLLRASLPGKKLPKKKVPQLAPDLVIEVFSTGNTKKEMQQKCRDYFLAGVKQVWILYPKKKSAEVFSDPTHKQTLNETQSLDGGHVLPGFVCPLATLFAKAESK